MENGSLCVPWWGDHSRAGMHGVAEAGTTVPSSALQNSAAPKATHQRERIGISLKILPRKGPFSFTRRLEEGRRLTRGHPYEQSLPWAQGGICDPQQLKAAAEQMVTASLPLGWRGSALPAPALPAWGKGVYPLGKALLEDKRRQISFLWLPPAPQLRSPALHSSAWLTNSCPNEQ